MSRDDDARYSRGRPAGRNGVPVWVWALLGSLGLLLTFCCGGLAFVGLVGKKSEKEVASRDVPDDSGPVIDGNGVARDYEENSVAADQKWLGKRIRVTKQEVKVGRTERSGVAYITSPLEYCGTSTRRDGTGIIFYFDKADEEPISGVKQTWPPQLVTIEGICRGKKDRSVVVEHCKITKIADQPKPPSK